MQSGDQPRRFLDGSAEFRLNIRVIRNIVLMGIGLAMLIFVCALFWPALVAWRAKEARAHAESSLRQIGLAMLHLHDGLGRLPPAIGWMNEEATRRSPPPTFGNAFFHLVPFVLEGSPTMRTETMVDGKWAIVPWTEGEWNIPGLPFQEAADPSRPRKGVTDDGWATCSFAFNAQVFARTDGDFKVVSWDGKARIPSTFQDGTSTTILATLKYARCGDGGSLFAYWQPDPWLPTFAAWKVGVRQEFWSTTRGVKAVEEAKFQIKPDYRTDECDPTRASTYFKAGIPVVMADGSGRFVSAQVSGATWWMVCTPSGGEAGNW
jgi:hypothetical protein